MGRWLMLAWEIKWYRQFFLQTRTVLPGIWPSYYLDLFQKFVHIHFCTLLCDIWVPIPILIQIHIDVKHCDKVCIYFLSLNPCFDELLYKGMGSRNSRTVVAFWYLSFLRTSVEFNLATESSMLPISQFWSKYEHIEAILV